MRRIVGIILFVAMMVGGAQAGDWPMFGHDAAHSGVADEVVEPPLELLWKYPAGYAIDSSPVVSGGTVFVGSYDMYLYALDARSGNLKWKYKTNMSIQSPPAVSGGAVYVVSSGLYVLDADTGNLMWEKFCSNSPVVSGGSVYVGCVEYETVIGSAPSDDFSVAAVYEGYWYRSVYYLYALDASTGNLKWKYPTGYAINSYPAVSDGVVYLLSSDYYIYALDASTGNLKWKTKTDYSLNTSSSPVVSGGVVYVGSGDGYVNALDINTGNQKWKYQTDGGSSSPVVSGGVVYVGSGNGYFYALEASTGSLKWKQWAGGVVSSPAISGGVVYVGSLDGYVYALDINTGSLRWNYKTGSAIYSSSPAISQGTLYIGSRDGNLYAFKPSKAATSEGTLTTTSASLVNKGSTIPTEALLPETSESQDNFNLMRMNLILIILVILFSGMVAWLFLKLRERPHTSTAKVDKGLINETINAETMLKPESKAVDEVSLTSAPKIELKPESAPEKHRKGAEIKTAFGYKRATLWIILLILVGAIGYTVYLKYSPLTELSNCGNNCIDYKKVKLPQYETSVPDIKITEADAEKLIMDIPIIIYNPSMKDTETVKIDFDVFMEGKHLTKGTIPANQLPAKQNTTILIKDVVIKYEELGDVLQKVAERHGAEMVGGGKANISMTIDLLIYFPIEVFSINIHTFTIPIQIETEIPVDMLKQNEEAKKQIEEKVKGAIKEVQDREKLPFTVPTVIPTEIPSLTVPALTSTIQDLPTSTPAQPLPTPSTPQFP